MNYSNIRTLFLICVALCLQQAASAQFVLEKLGTYATGIFDEGAAEIVAHDPGTQRLFFVNADAGTVDVLDINDPTQPMLINQIDLADFGDGANSVDIFNGIVAVAVEADESTDPGQVVFLDTDGNVLNNVTVGVLPDMVTFANEGSVLLVANEGEPNDDYDVDPEGSVSIVDLSAGVENATVTQVSFTSLNDQRDALISEGVRIFGPNATVAQDLEPEYIAVDESTGLAYVSCQENNAFVVVDIAAAEVVDVLPLGYKDHSIPSNGFDASNRDDNIEVWERPTLGMYQPDAIKTFEANGQTYIITANEGDARDYDGFSEEARVEDLTLDPTAYPNAASLQMEENLGRLNTTTATGDIDGDGDVDQIYSYGARSFSIWDTNGNQVYDSGNEFEKFLSQIDPENFNSNNDENGSRKSRSDDKGPEPEAVATATINGKLYAFIGLERQGGLMVYDITDPANAKYQFYINNRNFDVDAESPEVGDLGVEDIRIIRGSDSPTGRMLVVTSNEVSGTVTIFGVFQPEERVAVQILHNNDGESQLVNAGEGFEEFGGIHRFKAVVDSLRYQAWLNKYGTMTLSSGDNFLPGPEFNANLNRPAGTPFYDATALEAIGYDALAIGNHDFDFGPDILAEFMNDFDGVNPVYVSANLDFTNEPDLQALADAGRIVPSRVVYRGEEAFGIIGLTTPRLDVISSPRNVEVLEDLTGILQARIDEMEARGVNKIIVISHLQGIDEELALIPTVTGADIFIAGGGDELLTNDTTDAQLFDGLEVFGEYPLRVADAAGDTVYVVTTPGEYRFVGQLIATFDDAGKVISIGEESGPVVVRTSRPDAELESAVVEPVAEYLDQLDANILATSEVPLDGTRNGVRTMETNEGNLIADALLWQANELADEFGTATPMVALQNGGGIRNNTIIDPGPISELTTFNMVPFANFVSVVEPMPADSFLAVLENAVSRVEFTDGRFAQVAGFSFVYDPAAEAGSRVVSATLNDGTVIVENGAVVADAPMITIATINFLATGGDNYPLTGFDFTSLGVTYQQALANYLTDSLNGTISAADYPAGGEGRITTVGGGAQMPAIATNNSGVEGVTAFPNPFDEFFTVSYELEAAQQVNVFVLDIQGRVLGTVFNGVQESGAYQLDVNAADFNMVGQTFFVAVKTAKGVEMLPVIQK